MKWVTTTKNVDLATGEILTNTEGYILMRSYYKTEQHKLYYHKEYIKEYKKSKNQKSCQTTLL